jgi:AhpD family alkylhydroperoxidase
MSARINISQLEPQAIKAMMGLENYMGGADLPPKLCELIKIRASIVNNCAYCIQMHTLESKKLGEDEQRLFALAAWQESPLFTDKERSVLALTDAVTDIAKEGVTDVVYRQCLAVLGEQALAQCMMQIVTINAWNRIAVATKMQF